MARAPKKSRVTDDETVAVAATAESSSMEGGTVVTAEPANAGDEAASDEVAAPAAKPRRKAPAKKKVAAEVEAEPAPADPVSNESLAATSSAAVAEPAAAADSPAMEGSPVTETPPAPAAAKARSRKKAVVEPAAVSVAVAPLEASNPAPVGPSAGPAFPQTEYAVVEKILVGFVGAEVRKVGLSRAVLGLSGGIDSAVSAALAARALGPSNVLGVIMPYSASSPESLADAYEVAACLGIETVVIEITEQIDAYFRHHPDASRLRRGNKMARERMTILYDLSAARSALVVGTSNKTELLLGYGTLYGDMASALNPIGDLYKTQVWGLARHLGLPASVIDKAPTADLWSGQTDETELGFSYHDVDRLLYRMIDERCSNEELLSNGFDEAFVERVARMVRSSQFKRRLPIIAKLSARSIDTDFRYSRDWGL